MQTILTRLLDGVAASGTPATARRPAEVSGCASAQTALLLARLLAAGGRSLCCLTPSEEVMQTLAQDFAFFSAAPVLIFPESGIPPYTVLKPEAAASAGRVAFLHQVHELNRPALILSTVEAICRRLPPSRRIQERSELILRGEDCDRDGLIAAATAAGYHPCALVRQEGDMAVRGGIIDIWPPPWRGEASAPLRLDFFGDTVESIRPFDPATQRSSGEVDELILLPPTEWLYPKKATEQDAVLDAFDRLREAVHDPAPDNAAIRTKLGTQQDFAGLDLLAPLLTGQTGMRTFFDCLPEPCPLLLFDAPACAARQRLFFERLAENFAEAQAGGLALCPPADIFLGEDELTDLLARNTLARLSRLPDPDAASPVLPLPVKDHSLLAQEMALSRQKQGVLAPLSRHLLEWRDQGDATVLACRSSRQAAHLQTMLSQHGVEVESAEAPCAVEARKATRKGQVICLPQPLSQGFDLPEEGLHVLAAAELFGERRISRRRNKRLEDETPPLNLEELHQGDIVVHADHGIARFEGLVNLDFAGQRGDFLLLLFRDEDKLYVPVDKLHKVGRYQGLSEEAPRLDALGSQHWNNAKKKVSDAVWRIAQELLDIYAKRAMREGHSFSRPGEFYRELEESFPYDETPGQLKAIDEVVSDLCKDQPMDRLVCGDVGYGKTEVAARAAFKVVEDGYQVAVLAPTTVLAEQHLATFNERFGAFPVRIACLNRFRTKAEQKRIVADLAAGDLDIVIGTHRLLSKDISYRRLGLLVVDEEHRFGVAHKEKIKKIKTDVDVLTLTATPIPRTLQMSLLGIRDLSVISTPPRQRRPVRTLLAKREPLVIREACQRELDRQGQVFFLHNRVQSIMQTAARVAELIPQARVGVAHGQMPAEELENVIVDFIHHKLDILVCTTIIESGLDIPNANTILIDRADRIGLADLYQLRGRVGRSDRQAYAYLLVPSLDHLTSDAERRLQALLAHSDLGAGFQVAMNDLQIRGGGNLLGVSQSGHIAAVGYDLYLQLLQDTVADLRARQAGGDDAENQAASFDPEIKLKGEAFLPESYIRDTGLRYQFYRRLSYAGNGGPQELAALSEELEDRFGPLPPEAAAMFQAIAFKQRLRTLRITRLEQGRESLVFCFDASTPVRPEPLMALVEGENARRTKTKTAGRVRSNAAQSLCRLTPEGHLILPLAAGDDVAAVVDRTLCRLEDAATPGAVGH